MRTVFRILVIGVLAVLAASISPSAASAAPSPVVEVPDLPPAEAAIGSTPIGSFGYSFGGVTINVPTGCFFTHRIEGDRTRIDSEYAGVDCAGPAALRPSLFCNYNVVFRYYNTSNTQYLTKSTPVRQACGTQIGLQYAPGAPFGLNTGRACAEFRVNGIVRATQCHNIVR